MSGKESSKNTRGAGQGTRKKKDSSLDESIAAVESPTRQYAKATITELFGKQASDKDGQKEAFKKDLDKELLTLIQSLERKVQALPTKEFKKVVTNEVLTETVNAMKEELKQKFSADLSAAYNYIKTVESKQEKTSKQVEYLRSEISDMETKMSDLEVENESLRVTNDQLVDRLNQSNAVIKANEVCINNLEQYSRVNNIRIYGIDDKKKNESPDETAEEVCKLLNRDLQMKVSKSDIDIAHRMGQYRDDGKRPIICKFISRKHKIEAISRRKKLKGSGKGLQEDLTYKNVKLLEAAADNASVKASWSDH